MLIRPDDFGEANVQHRTNEKRDIHEDLKLMQHADAGKRNEIWHYWMKCPKCGMDLVEIDYKNIKVDKCSACEGVWLDTGEMVTLMLKVARTRSK